MLPKAEDWCISGTASERFQPPFQVIEPIHTVMLGCPFSVAQLQKVHQRERRRISPAYSDTHYLRENQFRSGWAACSHLGTDEQGLTLTGQECFHETFVCLELWGGGLDELQFFEQDQSTDVALTEPTSHCPRALLQVGQQEAAINDISFRHGKGKVADIVLDELRCITESAPCGGNELGRAVETDSASRLGYLSKEVRAQARPRS